MSFKSYFITTTIPYVNSKPHIGHAQEFILADALARHYKQLNKSVLLQSGTDDNATKNVLAAQIEGVSTKEFVDLNATKFEELLSLLKIRPDLFVRTSSSKHFLAVQKFLSLLKKEDLYQATYEGLYCSGCEDYIVERDLVEGCCPDHRKPPEKQVEQNIFFRLSQYQSKIISLIETKNLKIIPETKTKEILSFLKGGLNDISLSRSTQRTFGWGVPYPDFENQTVYVWIDALINYLTGSGFGTDEAWKSVWNNETYKIHVIGKNVWKFHAIYWPALLLSANLPLPNEIIIHGFLTNEGVKISKSLNNGVDPSILVERYGADTLRSYLVGSLSPFNDSDFDEKKLKDFYNSELANKLGNLVSRLLNLAQQSNLTLPSLPSSQHLPPVTFQDRFKFGFEIISKINFQINEERPWDLLKQGKRADLQSRLNQWLIDLNLAANTMEPLIPEGAEKLKRYLIQLPEVIEPLYPRR